MMSEQLSFIDIITNHIESGNMVLPVFSSTAMRVQQELVKKDPDLNLIAKIITVDQSLSSQVLKIANSAFYKGLAEISTIRAAIVRLGMQEIGRITLFAAARNQFRSGDPLLNKTMKQLWQHSLGCAMGANWLARRCKLDELGGHAFFAALLHDVGKLFVLIVLDELKKQDREMQITEALLFEAMTSLHAEHGYNLMRGWNMPELYCKTVRDHHIIDFDHKDMVLILVRLSNIVCTKLGIGIRSNATKELIPSTTVEATLLNLSEIDLAELEIMLEDTRVITS